MGIFYNSEFWCMYRAIHTSHGMIPRELLYTGDARSLTKGWSVAERPGKSPAPKFTDLRYCLNVKPDEDHRRLADYGSPTDDPSTRRHPRRLLDSEAAGHAC